MYFRNYHIYFKIYLCHHQAINFLAEDTFHQVFMEQSMAPGSAYHCCTCRMREEGLNGQTHYGTMGLRVLLLMFYYSEENVPLWGEMGGYTLQLPWSIYKLLICT